MALSIYSAKLRPRCRRNRDRHARTRLRNFWNRTGLPSCHPTVPLVEFIAAKNPNRSQVSAMLQPLEPPSNAVFTGEKQSHQQISNDAIIKRPDSRRRPERGDQCRGAIHGEKYAPHLGNAARIRDRPRGEFRVTQSCPALDDRWRKQQAISK